MVRSVHSAQDWALEESRTSLEVLERLEGSWALNLSQDAEEGGRGACPNYGDEEAGWDAADFDDDDGGSDDSMEVDQNVVDLEGGSVGVDGGFTCTTLGQPAPPPQPSTTRQAARRRRLRRERPSPLPRRENLAKGRVQKACALSLHTETQISQLKPGLKFQDGKAKVYTLKALQKRGFKVIPWDGK